MIINLDLVSVGAQRACQRVIISVDIKSSKFLSTKYTLMEADVGSRYLVGSSKGRTMARSSLPQLWQLDSAGVILRE